MFKINNDGSYAIKPNLTLLITNWLVANHTVMSNSNLFMSQRPKIENCEAPLQMRVQITERLNGAGLTSGEFFASVQPEIDKLAKAYSEFHNKVRGEGLLFLDDDCYFRKPSRPLMNPSSDAE